MSNKCVGLGCNIRFDKDANSKKDRRYVFNQNCLWLRNMLQSEGVVFKVAVSRNIFG